MRLPISAGSAVVFAMLTLGSAPATACGWGGWGGCGCAAYGYGYDDYGGPAYAYDAPPAYYARPAYAYAPPAYYAPPPAYYAPPVYHAGPTFASYAPPGYAPPPPGYYSPPTFGVPYSGRGGYNAAAGPQSAEAPYARFHSRRARTLSLRRQTQPASNPTSHALRQRAGDLRLCRQSPLERK